MDKIYDAYKIQVLDTQTIRKNAYITSDVVFGYKISKEETNLNLYPTYIKGTKKTSFDKIFFEDYPEHVMCDMILSGDGIRQVEICINGDLWPILTEKEAQKHNYTIDRIAIDPFGPNSGGLFKSQPFTTILLVVKASSYENINLEWKYCKFDKYRFDKFLSNKKKIENFSYKPFYDFPIKTSLVDEKILVFRHGIAQIIKNDYIGSHQLLQKKFGPKKVVNPTKMYCTFNGNWEILDRISKECPHLVEGFVWDGILWNFIERISIPVWDGHKDEIEEYILQQGGSNITWSVFEESTEETIEEARIKSNLYTNFYYELWKFLRFGDD